MINMSKGLILTEKPSVSRDITKALGGFTEMKNGEYYESDDFICTYAVGHILTLLAPEDIKPEYKRWRLADLPILPETFQSKPVSNQQGRLKTIARLMKRKDVSYLVNACDAAREGELIFREIVDYLEIKKPIRRLWLQSMTKKAIQDGFKQLQDGEKFNGLAAAAACRAHADWLIGMNATRALTVRLKSRNQKGLSWSAGRVQTPTLGLLVDRELEVLEHVPKPYWRLKGEFEHNGAKYEGIWFDQNFDRKKLQDRELKDDRIFDLKKAEEIREKIAGKSALASEVRRPSPRKAPPLFDLTSLQRAANSRFGWSATRTLKAAQRCYEAHKVLTYPRTSSKNLPEDYRGEVQKVLQAFQSSSDFAPHADHLLKKGLLNKEKVFNDAGVTDHFAIIPTGELKSLEGDDAKIFDLVSRQFMAAFYPPAIYEEVERTTEVEGEVFKSRPPKVLKTPGWEAVFGKTIGQQSESFSPLSPGKDKVEGVGVKSLKVDLEALETKPPGRISEAGLLSLMENAGRRVEDEELASALKGAEGLGTAATRADIIENLKNREYVDQSLRPTTKGIRLIDTLHRIKASRLTSPELTARLELHLSEVESGKRTAAEFMREVGEYAKEVVERATDFDYEEIYPSDESLGSCPRCGRSVFEKAWFYGCEEATKRNGTKDCEFLIWKDHNGRFINRQVVRTLLEKKVTPELDGFKSPSGKAYSAILELEGANLVRKSLNEQDDLEDNIEVNPEPLGKCPVDCNPSCQVVETARDFVCQTKLKARDEGDKGAAGFSFPRMLCKRMMKRDEIVSYITSGETPIIYDFISKRGRKFSAKLVMENEGAGFRFEFPPRGSKKKAGEKEAGEEKSAQQTE
jgi:DNA topoisomerase-3